MTEEKHKADPGKMNQTSKNSLFTKLLFIMLLVAVGATVVQQMRQSPGSSTPINNKTFIELPDRKPLPVVTLTQAGKGEVTTEMMKGRWHLLFFGYTFCPDVCPVELSVLHQMMDILREQIASEQLPQTVFISIDPERDTPEMTAEYVEYFDPEFIGLTGTKTDLQILTMPFGITWMKQRNSISDKKTDENNYLVSHTTTIILVNPDMKVAGLFPAPHSAGEMAEMYQKIIHKEVR
jgi:protein SCO1/2